MTHLKSYLLTHLLDFFNTAFLLGSSIGKLSTNTHTTLFLTPFPSFPSHYTNLLMYSLDSPLNNTPEILSAYTNLLDFNTASSRVFYWKTFYKHTYAILFLTPFPSFDHTIQACLCVLFNLLNLMIIHNEILFALLF